MSARVLSRLLLSALALPTLALASACERAPAPPRNDNFAAPTVLPAAGQGHLVSSTVGATRQAGEPASEKATTVWFRWTAPATGAATFAVSSGLPMSVGSYTGTQLNRLYAVAGDEGLSRVAFRTVRGTAYTIRVAGVAGATFAMKWSTSLAPANDRRAAAASISGGTGSLVGNSMAATGEPGDPRIDGDRPPATVWYRWTAPVDGWYDFDTNGSQIGTELGVYTDDGTARLVDDSSGQCGGAGFFDASATSSDSPQPPGAATSSCSVRPTTRATAP